MAGSARMDRVLDLAGLQALLDALANRGYTVVGPTLHEGVVVHDVIRKVDDLPRGRTDEQAPGHYRTRERDDDALFGYASAAQSWKRQLFPPRQLLWQHGPDGRYESGAGEVPQQVPRYALLGVRACELAAIARHDHVLLQRGFVDADYAARRQPAFLVAVACSSPAGTCFCAATGTGPRPEEGYDLLLTELIGPVGGEPVGGEPVGGEPVGGEPVGAPDGPPAGDHRFYLEAGSEAGAALLAELPGRRATAADRTAAADVSAHAAAQMGRRLEVEGLHDLLYREVEHPQWDDIAERCLSCGNCTAVCPTCFCTTIDDVTDLSGQHSERYRVWDSCFTAGFSYLHGGSVRSSARSRYRQWATHKFAAWQDQFGELGCVGCGRCITWCPAGIDITEELAALRQRSRSRPTTRAPR